ncbi:MAG: LamG domain-containing protein [Pirellulales bacterium]|nr:LamG domain-containing protein [Pirellulales bacterium]
MKLLWRMALAFVVCLCLGVSATQAELIAHYTFDDGTAANSSGKANLDGVLVGNAVIVDDAVRGSKVLELDGVDLNENSSYVTIPDPDEQLDLSATGTGECTVAAWIYTEREVNPHQAVFSQGQWSEGVCLIVRGDAGSVLWSGRPNSVISEDMPPRSVWTHVAMTVSGSSTTFYIDGETSGVNLDRGGPLTAPVRDSAIGKEQAFEASSWIRYIFEGRIDDFRIYDNALTQAEIQAVMTVPEPATLTMTLMLLGSLVVLRIRRKR